ncbi:MAG: DUF6732 family protein [Pseudomonadota bacterium]
MVRTAITFGLTAIATPAWAHVGHLGEVAGHGHWIALGAGTAAIAIGAALAKLSGQKSEATEESDDCEANEGETEAEAKA